MLSNLLQQFSGTSIIEHNQSIEAGIQDIKYQPDYMLMNVLITRFYSHYSQISVQMP